MNMEYFLDRCFVEWKNNKHKNKQNYKKMSDDLRKRATALAICAKLAWSLLFDYESEDEDEDEEVQMQTTNREVGPKTEDFFVEKIEQMDSQQFKAQFRLSTETFEYLYNHLASIDSNHLQVRRGRPPVVLEKQVLITLWYLANNECFRSVGDRFGVCKKACWAAVYAICKSILKLNVEQKIICWPSSQEARRIANHFRDRTKFPGIIGCIDASHIKIQAPKIEPNSYVNRNNFHSVLLQGVCNEQMMFTDCYAGEFGSLHNSIAFSRSKLFKRISDGSLSIEDNHHLLGDRGYDLRNYLLIPFRDNGSLTDVQKNYNRVSSAIRVVIKRAFELLKCRFRRLQKLETNRPDLIPLVIMASCILHNVCIKLDDFIEFDFVPDDDDNTPAPTNGENHRAQLKRSAIANALV